MANPPFLISLSTCTSPPVLPALFKAVETYERVNGNFGHDFRNTEIENILNTCIAIVNTFF